MKAKDLGMVLVIAAAVVVSFVVADRRSGSPPASPADGGPVAVEAMDGTGLYRVRLSARAAERLGIETSAGAAVVPYSAVLYDLHGDTWVYTTPEPLVFQRQRVRVDRIDGNRAILAEGPPAGSTIVTVGGAELLAAELDH